MSIKLTRYRGVLGVRCNNGGLYFFSGGMWRSYCGLSSSEVCCFVAVNAKPIGILPSPSKTTCGQKGANGDREGETEMAEWPWHVSTFLCLIYK